MSLHERFHEWGSYHVLCFLIIYPCHDKQQELMNQWTTAYCCNFPPKVIKEKHIFEQDEGGLSQIISSLGNIYTICHF